MRSFSRFLVFLAFLPITIVPSGALAGPISLFPLDGDSAPSIVPTFNVYGRCGGAVVQIVGVQKDTIRKDRTWFEFDESALKSGRVLVLTNSRETSLEVSQYNTVLCVPVQGEFRLVVGSGCGGSSCTDAFNYVIFNPKQQAVVSPKKCDIFCSSKLLKSNVLSEIGLM